jgi:hypothetical protein
MLFGLEQGLQASAIQVDDPIDIGAHPDPLLLVQAFLAALLLLGPALPSANGRLLARRPTRPAAAAALMLLLLKLLALGQSGTVVRNVHVDWAQHLIKEYFTINQSIIRLFFDLQTLAPFLGVS